MRARTHTHTYIQTQTWHISSTRLDLPFTVLWVRCSGLLYYLSLRLHLSPNTMGIGARTPTQPPQIPKSEDAQALYINGIFPYNLPFFLYTLNHFYFSYNMYYNVNTIQIVVLHWLVMIRKNLYKFSWSKIFQIFSFWDWLNTHV